MAESPAPVVWLDFENTPQVLFLEPIATQLRARGFNLLLTAKPQSQTLDLARHKNLPAIAVGSGNLRGVGAKVAGGGQRVWALWRWLRSLPEKPRLLVHSSRSASLAAMTAGVPAVGLLDYEHAIQWPLALASARMWFPDIIGRASLPLLSRRVAGFYEGLKENFYLDGRPPVDRTAIRRQWGADLEGSRLVVARPPAESAHYADESSWRWWVAAIQSLLQQADTVIVVVPRDAGQGARVANAVCASGRFHVLSHVVDAPRLVAAADLVVGGGGTMNREAAVLGTHAWSTFCGSAPAVDEQLAREGRLTWVRSAADLRAATHRPFPRHSVRTSGPGFQRVLSDIVGRIR